MSPRVEQGSWRASGSRRRATAGLALIASASISSAACEEPAPATPVEVASEPRSTSRFAPPTVEVHVLPAPSPEPVAAGPPAPPAPPPSAAPTPHDPPIDGHTIGGVIGGVIGSPGTLVDGKIVLPFGAGMSRPSRISGSDPVYSKKAREAKVEGTVLVKCVIETSGSLSHCELVKTLPFMSLEILTAVSAWRFTPVMFAGKPIRVIYTIPIRLRLE